MTTNSQLSTNEPKIKERRRTKTKTKQTNRNRIREMDITMEDFEWGEEERNGGKRYREVEA